MQHERRLGDHAHARAILYEEIVSLEAAIERVLRATARVAARECVTEDDGQAASLRAIVRMPRRCGDEASASDDEHGTWPLDLVGVARQLLARGLANVGLCEAIDRKLDGNDGEVGEALAMFVLGAAATLAVRESHEWWQQHTVEAPRDELRRLAHTVRTKTVRRPGSARKNRPSAGSPAEGITP